MQATRPRFSSRRRPTHARTNAQARRRQSDRHRDRAAPHSPGDVSLRSRLRAPAAFPTQESQADRAMTTERAVTAWQPRASERRILAREPARDTQMSAGSHERLGSQLGRRAPSRNALHSSSNRFARPVAGVSESRITTGRAKREFRRRGTNACSTIEPRTLPASPDTNGSLSDEFDPGVGHRLEVVDGSLRGS